MVGNIPFNKLEWGIPYFEPYIFVSGGGGGQEGYDFLVPSGHIMRFLAGEISSSNVDDVGIVAYMTVNAGRGQEPINLITDRLHMTVTAGLQYIPPIPVYAYYSVGMGVYNAIAASKIYLRLQAQTAVFR